MPDLAWIQVPAEIARLVRAGRTKAALELQKPLGVMADLSGFQPGPINALYGGPRPLSSLLAGSALGAGAGYGTGWLAEKLLPDYLKDKRLRKTLAVLGGAIGAIPGGWQSYDQLRQGGSVLEPWPKAAALLERAEQYLEKLLPAIKSADEEGPSAIVSSFAPVVSRDRVNAVVWDDPFLTQPIAAGASGLVEAASQTRGGVNWVSPWDIAKITAGMGSGLISGLVVGKTLGAVAGLSQPAQQTLQRAGVIAGLLNNVVPLAFGGR